MKANVWKSFEKLCHVPCGNELMCVSAEHLVLAGRGGRGGQRRTWPAGTVAAELCFPSCPSTALSTLYSVNKLRASAPGAPNADLFLGLIGPFEVSCYF